MRLAARMRMLTALRTSADFRWTNKRRTRSRRRGGQQRLSLGILYAAVNYCFRIIAEPDASDSRSQRVRL